MNQQFEIITLGKTKTEEVIKALGNPLKETKRLEFDVYWYTSTGPTTADFIYLKNDRVVMKSQNVNELKKPVSQYIQELGKPEKILEQQDVLTTFIYILPSQGKTILAYGESENSPSVRLYEYSPTTLTNYFETVGQDFKEYKQGTTLEQKLATITTASTSSSQSQASVAANPNRSAFIKNTEMIGILIAVVLGVLLLLKIYKRRKIPKATGEPQNL